MSTQDNVNRSDKPILEKKQTKLGLYVTAKQAYEMWQADPERVKILDVRTPEEYYFVGHAAMARNIPVGFVTYQWNADKKEPVFVPGADFISSIKSLYSVDDRLLLICRSGGRSALAVNALAQAGFENVYNIIDGMEGDLLKDPDSVYDGKRMMNGWKNSGLPWTYDVKPELLWIATDESV